MTHSITTPSATVDYDRYGEGPPLLLIPGGSGDAGVLGPLAAHLADRFTVIAMYSRIASRDRGDAAPGDQHPADQADDAYALLAQLTDEPAIVFGTSAGSVAAIELALRHPDRVRLVVAHEPPMVHLLPDAAQQQAMFESVRAAARNGDTAEAASIITTGMTTVYAEDEPVRIRHDGDWPDRYADTEPEPPAPELTPVLARLSGLQPAFLEHVLVQYVTHNPDPDALKAAAPRLVPAAGIDSRGQLPYRAAASLATRLGQSLTELPGGHLGTIERPALFAAALKDLLRVSG